MDIDLYEYYLPIMNEKLPFIGLGFISFKHKPGYYEIYLGKELNKRMFRISQYLKDGFYFEHEIEKVFATGETETKYDSLPDIDEETAKKFVEYIKEHIAEDEAQTPSTFLIYKISNLNNLNKWLEDFYAFQEQQQQDFKKLNENKTGVQTVLF